MKEIVTQLSNLSFGAYAVHLICQTIVGSVLGIFMPMSTTKLICSFVFVSLTSFAVSLIASKIPVIKKSVRM